MKKNILLTQMAFLLMLTTMISTLSAEVSGDPKSKLNTAHIQMGLLGYEVGTYLTIEGHYSAPQPNKKMRVRTLYVDKVNDRVLDKPRAIFIENEPLEKLRDGTRCILRGYESGCWIGTPDSVVKATGRSSQVVWQFDHKFIVTSVISPHPFDAVNEPTPVKTQTFERQRPAISAQEAILRAEQYIAENHIDVSAHFISSASYFDAGSLTDSFIGKGPYWHITYELIEPTAGGQQFILVYMDGKTGLIGER